MKKTMTAMAMFLTIGWHGAFANGNDGIDRRIETSFKTDFNKAQSVSWQHDERYVRAKFSIDGRIQYAFYNSDGDLKAVAHHLLTNRLPENLQHRLKKKYSGYWVNDLFEMTTDDDHNYYIHLENRDEKLVLKSDGGHWQVFKQEKKSDL